jgi:hypothetical protein
LPPLPRAGAPRRRLNPFGGVVCGPLGPRTCGVKLPAPASSGVDAPPPANGRHEGDAHARPSTLRAGALARYTSGITFIQLPRLGSSGHPRRSPRSPRPLAPLLRCSPATAQRESRLTPLPPRVYCDVWHMGYPCCLFRFTDTLNVELTTSERGVSGNRRSRGDFGQTGHSLSHRLTL